MFSLYAYLSQFCSTHSRTGASIFMFCRFVCALLLTGIPAGNQQTTPLMGYPKQFVFFDLYASWSHNHNLRGIICHLNQVFARFYVVEMRSYYARTRRGPGLYRMALVDLIAALLQGPDTICRLIGAISVLL